MDWPPIRGHEVRPIPGGWTCKLTLEGLNHLISGRFPAEILRQALQILVNNGKRVDPEVVKEHLSAQWQRRAGDRWIANTPYVLAEPTPRREPIPMPTRVPTPKDWGRQVWETMNWSLAAQGDLPLWRTTVELARQFIASSEVGCAECATHFAQFLTENPLPETVAEARQWTFRAHQNANRHARQKSSPAYDTIATRFLWQ